MADDFNDFLIDAELGIETTGRNDKFSDTFRYPYEPTTYSVLNRIVEEGYIGADDFLVDYGSGKGRVPIYLNYLTGCSAVGIEMVDEFYRESITNLENYLSKMSTEPSRDMEKIDLSFIKAQAEKWEIPNEANYLFFFNPFSVKILRGVMEKIMDSYYANPRNIRMFFYYPQDEYIAYLSTIDEIDFLDEIDCRDLFKQQDDRNRVMIFEMIE